MQKIKIGQGDWVVVCDGKKALILENVGDGKFPNLQTREVFEQANPPTHEQGSDAPGRSIQSVGSARSAMEQTDWHDIEKHRFTRTVAGALDRFLSELKAEHVVIVAPPRTLADLGRSLSQTVQDSIVAELAKDLTGLSVSDISQYLAARS